MSIDLDESGRVTESVIGDSVVGVLKRFFDIVFGYLECESSIDSFGSLFRKWLEEAILEKHNWNATWLPRIETLFAFANAHNPGTWRGEFSVKMLEHGGTHYIVLSWEATDEMWIDLFLPRLGDGVAFATQYSEGQVDPTWLRQNFGVSGCQTSNRGFLIKSLESRDMSVPEDLRAAPVY